jgi:hypothetical protein
MKKTKKKVIETVYDELVPCPFCKSTDSCDHCLACMDFHWGEIEGGFLWDNEEPAFGLIRRAFLEAHAQKNKKPPFHQSSDFMKLWKKSTFDPSDEDCPLDIPSSELYPLVAERLCDAGAVRIDQVLNRPCFTFPACNLYAENIDEVLERYEKDLRRDLGIAEKSVEEENQK